MRAFPSEKISTAVVMAAIFDEEIVFDDGFLLAGVSATIGSGNHLLITLIRIVPVRYTRYRTIKTVIMPITIKVNALLKDVVI